MHPIIQRIPISMVLLEILKVLWMKKKKIVPKSAHIGAIKAHTVNFAIPTFKLCLAIKIAADPMVLNPSE